MKSVVKLLATVLLVLAVGFASQSAQAQGFGGSTISGFVFDDTRRPISDVLVELRNEYNSVLRRTRTQTSGQYSFTGLSQGRFTVYVLPLATGYGEASADVEIAGIGVRGRQLSDNVQQDIYLKPRKTRPSGNVGKGAVVFAQEVPPSAQKLYESGSEDIDRQKVDTGVRDLEAAIVEFPKYFMALQKLAYVRLAQKDLKVAEALFERAVAVNPQSYECIYGLGATQYSMGDNKAALSNLEKAVVMRSDSFESNLLLGMAQRQDGQYAEAEKTFKQALKAADDTNEADVHWNLALLYAHNMDRYSDAAKELEQYLKLAPDAPNKEDIRKLIKEFKDKAHSSK